MEFKLKTNKFTATDKLMAYVEKKVAKLEKHENVQHVEFTLEVVKPETAKNKEARLNVVLAGRTIHAEKTADTFEEAVDLCIDVARRELAENKENFDLYRENSDKVIQRMEEKQLKDENVMEDPNKELELEIQRRKFS